MQSYKLALINASTKINYSRVDIFKLPYVFNAKGGNYTKCEIEISVFYLLGNAL